MVLLILILLLVIICIIELLCLGIRKKEELSQTNVHREYKKVSERGEFTSSLTFGKPIYPSK